MRRLFSVVFLAIFILSVFVAFAQAAELPLEAYNPHLMKDEFYSEQWSASIWAENGYYVHVQFAISNIGMGDHKGVVKVEVTHPDEKREGAYLRVNGDWNYEKEVFKLNFNGNVWEKQGEKFHVKAGDDDINTELTLTVESDPWRPGGKRGFYRRGKNIYDSVLLAPRMKAEGVLNLKGKKLAIKGQGLWDHSFSNIAPHKLAKRWLKFKYYDGDFTMLFTGLAEPSSGKDINRSWIWMGKGDKTLFHAMNPKVKYADEKEEGKYKVPQKILIRTKSGKRSLGVDIRQKKLLRRKDALMNLSKVERFVVERFAAPIDYTFNGDFLIQLSVPGKDGGEPKVIKIKGNSDYVMQYLNK